MTTITITVAPVDGGFKLVADNGGDVKESYASTVRKAASKAGELVKALLEKGVNQ